MSEIICQIVYQCVYMHFEGERGPSLLTDSLRSV